MKQKNSLLNWLRVLTALRIGQPALGADGEFEVVYAKEGQCPFVYLRELDGEKILVGINPSARAVTAEFSLPGVATALENLAGRGKLRGRNGRFSLDLPPIEALVIRVL